MQRIFVNDELKQINFLDERFYQYDENTYLPSATYVLKCYPTAPQLIQWYKDVGNNAKIMMERAAESGTKVHNAISEKIRDKKLSWDGKNYTEEEWVGILKFLRFKELTNPIIITNESKVFSLEKKYAGTIDLLCKIGDKIYLIDFKFANAVHNDYFLQLIAYKNAIEETHKDIKIDEIAILHLKADTKSEKIDLDKKIFQGFGWQLKFPKDSFETLTRIYDHVLDIFYYINPNPMPKNKVYPSEI